METSWSPISEYPETEHQRRFGGKGPTVRLRNRWHPTNSPTVPSEQERLERQTADRMQGDGQQSGDNTAPRASVPARLCPSFAIHKAEEVPHFHLDLGDMEHGGAHHRPATDSDDAEWSDPFLAEDWDEIQANIRVRPSRPHQTRTRPASPPLSPRRKSRGSG